MSPKKKTIKKSSYIKVGLIAFFFALLLFLYFVIGITPSYILNAPSVATAIGVKLACSGRYVSGFEADRIEKDIAIYSPILSLLTYSYDESQQTATASLFRLSNHQANYVKGIGCALVYEKESERNQIVWPKAQPTNEPWPKGERVETINQTLQIKLGQMLNQDNAEGHETRALLVAHKGSIVAEAYADGITQNTQLLGWSMTKGVNAIIFGHLEMQGKASIQDKHLYLEWQDARADIRIEHLLQMTDGLDYNEAYRPGTTATRMLFQERDAAEYVKTLPAKHAAGTYFNYSSGSSNLLSDLIQQRIEGDIQEDVDYITQHIFYPMGMLNTSYEMDSSGLFIASSYLYASARDWARIGQLMLNQGELNGIRIISKDYVTRSLTNNTSENKSDYGYQWWLNTRETPYWKHLPKTTYAARGNRGQRLLIIPERDLVIVRLGWSAKRYTGQENFTTIYHWFDQ